MNPETEASSGTIGTRPTTALSRGRRRRSGARTWAELAEHPDAVDLVADPATLEQLPDPARRFLTRVLPAGRVLPSATALEMHGEIALKGRWFRFEARQIMRPGVGFVWQAVVGGRIARFVGADVLGPNDARMEFRFHGIVPVVRASGPDIARSGAGRLAGETVAWMPQALLPEAGATWASLDDERAVVTLTVAGRRIAVEVTVDEAGRLRALSLDRWNDAAEPPADQPFGGVVHREFETDEGVLIARTGSVGWWWATPKWPTGEFFRYTVTATRSVAS